MTFKRKGNATFTKASGGAYRKLDVSWRKGEPIEVLVNPWGPEAPEMIEALTHVPLSNGRERGRRAVRFQLNALGIVWFGDAHTVMHGDESRGRVIMDGGQAAQTSGRVTDADRVPALVYGSIVFPEWKLDATDVGIDLAYLSAGEDMLPLFKRWRSAVEHTRLKCWGASRPWRTA